MSTQMTISQFIQQNNLLPADAVALACPAMGFPTHYALYLDNVNNSPRFIANITDGVQIISGNKLRDFLKKYQVIAIEPFIGTPLQRNAAIRKAIKRIGEKTYNLVFHNCEHFKNWALYGVSKSKQVETIGTGLAVGGLGLILFGKIAGSKGAQKAGWIILMLLVIVIIYAVLCIKKKENDDRSFRQCNDNDFGDTPDKS